MAAENLWSRSYRALSDFSHFVSRVVAVAGGLVLVALVVMTVISISGRALSFMGLGPVQGDFELVEAGIGFAIFAFLPWCTLNRGHATVEILAPLFGNRFNRVLDLVSSAVLLAVAILLTWRHWLGTLDKMAYGESTMILQMPLWWGYMAAALAACVFVFICAFCLLRSVVELVRNQHIDTMGAVH